MSYFLKMFLRFWMTLLFICCYICCSPISEDTPSSNQEHPEVTLMSTEKRTIHSEIVNQDYDILISLPYLYYKSDTTYPVLFSLDANVSFGTISNIANNLSTLNRELPEIVVVGIAYPINDIADWAALRKRDTTPTSNAEYDKNWADYLNKATGRDNIVVQSGGAELFLSFIIDELIPFIETNYRVSPTDRAIRGISSGGLFVLYALFNHSGVFHKYLAQSPSIQWDESYMYEMESDFALANDDLPVRLFMSVGGLESEVYIHNFNKMGQVLRSRNYPSFKIQTLLLENETHGTNGPSSLSVGLKMLYEK